MAKNQFNNTFSNPFLFIGRVTGVDTTNYQVDVKPTSHHSFLRGAKVLTANATEIRGEFRGFVWLPNVGDVVVCAFIEGISNYAVVLGAIYVPEKPDQGLVGRPTSTEGRVFTDYLVHHQTGSFIRMRTKDPPEYTSTGANLGEWSYDPNQRSQIEIKHKAGDQLLIDELTVGKTQFTYTHNTGTQIKIDTGGNVSITSPNIYIKGGHVELGNTLGEPLVLGDTFKTFFNSHIHPTGVGPSGQPTIPMSSSELSSNTFTV